MSAPDSTPMPHARSLRTSSSAALLGAAAIFVGCDDSGDDLDATDVQFQTTETDLDEMDPNELPPGVGGEDDTLGDSRLNDGTPEEPGVNEYDSTPLTPGED